MTPSITGCRAVPSWSWLSPREKSFGGKLGGPRGASLKNGLHFGGAHGEEQRTDGILKEKEKLTHTLERMSLPRSTRAAINPEMVNSRASTATS
jgi:hypothetical protein